MHNAFRDIFETYAIKVEAEQSAIRDYGPRLPLVHIAIHNDATREADAYIQSLPYTQMQKPRGYNDWQIKP